MIFSGRVSNHTGVFEDQSFAAGHIGARLSSLHTKKSANSVKLSKATLKTLSYEYDEDGESGLLNSTKDVARVCSFLSPDRLIQTFRI